MENLDHQPLLLPCVSCLPFAPVGVARGDVGARGTTAAPSPLAHPRGWLGRTTRPSCLHHPAPGTDPCQRRGSPPSNDWPRAESGLDRLAQAPKVGSCVRRTTCILLCLPQMPLLAKVRPTMCSECASVGVARLLIKYCLFFGYDVESFSFDVVLTTLVMLFPLLQVREQCEPQLAAALILYPLPLPWNLRLASRPPT